MAAKVCTINCNELDSVKYRKHKAALLRFQVITENSILAIRNRLRFGRGQRRLHRSAFRLAVSDRAISDSARSTPGHHIDVRQYST